MRKPLLLLPWAIALLLIHSTTGSIEYEDDDITFDDVPTRPEGPGRPLDPSELGLFASVLSRVKRGFFDFLDSSEEKSSSETNATSHDETSPATTPSTTTTLTTASSVMLASSPQVTSADVSHRVSRSTASDLKESDDEDIEPASGSGSPWEHTPGVLGIGHQDEQYIIFRIKMFIHEFWVRDYANKHSPAFQRFAANFTNELIQFFDSPVGSDGPLPGSRRATVIGIEPSLEDNMLILVTSDLGSKGNADGSEIKRRLRRHLPESNRLGSFPVKIDAAHPLTVQQFTEPNPSGFSECEANQVVCKDGKTCLSTETRCDGHNDCPEGEDEEDCPKTQGTSNGITFAPDTRRIDEVGAAPDRESVVAVSNAPTRCDDEKLCPNGYQKICDTQICDGNQDCDGQTEEVDCDYLVKPETPSTPTTTTTTTAPTGDCLMGEFMCDVSRCIPINKKCDGFADCNDKTDEEAECPPRQESVFTSWMSTGGEHFGCKDIIIRPS